MAKPLFLPVLEIFREQDEVRASVCRSTCYILERLHEIQEQLSLQHSKTALSCTFNFPGAEGCNLCRRDAVSGHLWYPNMPRQPAASGRRVWSRNISWVILAVLVVSPGGTLAQGASPT